MRTARDLVPLFPTARYTYCFHFSMLVLHSNNDLQVVCVWKMENGKLKMRYQRDIMTGSIRALRVLNENLVRFN